MESSARLGWSVYVCKDYAEFQKMNEELVANKRRKFWTAIQLIDTATGKTCDPPDGNLYVVNQAFVDALEGGADLRVRSDQKPISGAGKDAPEKPSSSAVAAMSDPAPDSPSSPSQGGPALPPDSYPGDGGATPPPASNLEESAGSPLVSSPSSTVPPADSSVHSSLPPPPTPQSSVVPALAGQAQPPPKAKPAAKPKPKPKAAA